MVYVYKETSCMCLKNGRWPHKRCRNVFNVMPSKQSCIPNSYIIEDCNVCRCGPTGKINRKHCTQNVCSEVINRRPSKLNKVQGSCEPSNWYSLAPCQFCYCVNENKLVCSTGNNKLNTMLELGAYNLTVCGKQMINEVIELIPEVQRSLLRGGNNSPTVKVTTELTMRQNENNIHTTYGYGASKTVLPKPGRLHATHKKSQGVEIDDNEPNSRGEREYVNNVSQIVKDTDSDSNSEVDNPIARTNKFTRKPPKRQRSVTTTILYKENETSEESTVVSDKPNTAEETTPVSIIKKAHIKIPLAANVTFDNVVDTQEAKPDLMNAASENEKDDAYKINIPAVLDRFFSMSMKRRSMVKLNAQSNCVPGETSKEGCNNCFCLANGKLLCTYNPCNGTTSQPQ